MTNSMVTVGKSGLMEPPTQVNTLKAKSKDKAN